MELSRKTTAVNLHKAEQISLLLIVLSSFVVVLHNIYVNDYEYIHPFLFNREYKIFKDVYMFYAAGHVSTILLLLSIYTLSQHKKEILIFTCVEFIALIDFFLTCNRDYILSGFDINTVKLVVYMVYAGTIILSNNGKETV